MQIFKMYSFLNGDRHPFHTLCHKKIIFIGNVDI